ncbi:hypothetical protein SPBRAN_156 [uncultured Candidatus Thioglobus sp.]|nr:hypothetical protein SPBRAN_156 [uncultured Candidatus Thioglobus sp.]
MLLEFSVTNFRSIKEKQTLSLLKSKLKDDGLEGNYSTITLSTGKTLDVLNSAVIYGANASGKSNLVLAMQTMFNIIEQSTNYQKNQGILGIELFSFSQENVKQPTEFELDFIDDGVRFVYGFSATQEKIIDEWLYQYPKGSPQNLIDRQATSQWGTMSGLKGKKKTWQESTKDNSLFFSTAVQLNSSQLTNIFYSIMKFRFAIHEFNHPMITIDAIENNGKKQQVLGFLNRADMSIKDIIIETKAVDMESIPENQRIVAEVDGIRVKTKHVETNIGFVHDNNVIFNLQSESSGTKKIFHLIGAWLDVLESGYCLVLDELQNSLHPKLVEYLVKMFHNPELNKNGAQLIFVTHETSLLDQDIFRRDQVWFCEKEDNATELFSLADFKVRKGVDDLEKAYLSGRYGAVPYLR